MTAITAADALKYAAAKLHACTEWTTDTIGGTDCGVDHDVELTHINDTATEICKLAGQYGDRNHYSNGRLIRTTADIEEGLMTAHVWNPDPHAEPRRSWRGNLHHDPDTPCPGIYEVTLEPATQDIHIRVIRTA